MEQLDFDGRILYFERKSNSGEYNDFYTTMFYTELRTKMVKKYWFFGPLIEVPDNEFAFELRMDIKSPYYTKEEVRKELQKNIDIFDRKIEIKNGKYV